MLAITQISFGQTASVKLSGSIFGAPTDTLFVSQMYDNNRIKDFDTIVMDKEGKFNAELTLPREDYYLLRLENSNVQPIVEMNKMIDVLRKYQSMQNLIKTDPTMANPRLQRPDLGKGGNGKRVLENGSSQ